MPSAEVTEPSIRTAWTPAIDRAMAEDKAGRARRKATAQAQRETLRARLKQMDEILVRARALAPAGPPGEEQP